NNEVGNTGFSLLGYPAYESSAMPTMPVGSPTEDVALLAFGDFRHYVIVDRVGMSVELIPHLFNANANLPDGRRGLYAYWRNSAEVVAPNAFRVLTVENTS